MRENTKERERRKVQQLSQQFTDFRLFPSFSFSYFKEEQRQLLHGHEKAFKIRIIFPISIPPSPPPQLHPFSGRSTRNLRSLCCCISPLRCSRLSSQFSSPYPPFQLHSSALLSSPTLSFSTRFSYKDNDVSS